MGRSVGRERNKLTALAISGKKKPGYYGDGDGLYLQVSASGTKSWVLRYTLNQRVREMGLGSASLFGLAQAREMAQGYRKLLTQKIDPIDHRNAEHAKIMLAAAQRRSFEQCAAELHVLKLPSWKNVKHGDQWINTLTTYAFPVFGKKDVTSVSKADVLRALEPIWTTKPETATRVRQRIKAVLDWAAARDYRQNHDPHMWDQISRALPSASEAKKPKHYEACPYLMVNEVIETIHLSGAEEAVRDAFEFLILTAARTGEVRGARWSEIDFAQKRWVIPAERMKASREHRIPLAPRCLEILARRRDAGSELVFANQKGRMLSNMVFTMLLRRFGYTFTTHGFRSTFRDWSAERTSYSQEVCEAALAHSVKDSTEAAYFRSDLFDKRRALMEAWATHCATKGDVMGEVVPIRAREPA